MARLRLQSVVDTNDDIMHLPNRDESAATPFITALEYLEASAGQLVVVGP